MVRREDKFTDGICLESVTISTWKHHRKTFARHSTLGKMEVVVVELCMAAFSVTIQQSHASLKDRDVA
jgi:hypothetical protein